MNYGYVSTKYITVLGIKGNNKIEDAAKTVTTEIDNITYKIKQH